MSRFANDDYDEYYNNQGEMWWANVQRALSGRKGQAALAELEEILVAMPEKRLIEGHLATKHGEVCAVGALVLHRRMSKGEKREAIIAELDALIQNDCGTCWHTERQHGEDGPCDACSADWPRRVEIGRADDMPICHEFVDAGYGGDAADWETAEAGKRAGLTFTLAWRLGYLNDEELRNATPEQRYDGVLAWVRKARTAVVPA